MEPTSQTALNHTESPRGMSLEEEVSGEGNKKLNKAIESHVIYLLEAAPAQIMKREGEFLDTVQLIQQAWHRKEE
ncbi:hypothetical protein [Desertivirga brevis]|uniref:hypothetical protein n=1 Tax=Desertivirga brevis TaxID=2810310 RepID=UPI001A964F94|nr:hypothetical protein [Pedobacter sp. SYSU D00873]